MRHVVVWGCPRSGTSIVFEAFKAHPRYRFFFEPGMWIFDGPQEYPTVVKNPVSQDPTRGLSADLDHVMQVFPGAVHVWVVRDPFDTVVSLMPGMAEQPHPPKLDQRWEDKPLVDRCAALWRLWNVEGRAQVEARTGVFEARYEDLVADPASVVTAMMVWAGALDEYDVESFARRVTDVPGVEEAAFQARWHRPHEAHVGRGLRELSELDRVTVENIIV